MSAKEVRIIQGTYNEPSKIHPDSSDNVVWISSKSNSLGDVPSSTMFEDERRVIEERISFLDDENRRRSLDDVAERLGFDR